jgi:hypothetical protein
MVILNGLVEENLKSEVIFKLKTNNHLIKIILKKETMREQIVQLLLKIEKYYEKIN